MQYSWPQGARATSDSRNGSWQATHSWCFSAKETTLVIAQEDDSGSVCSLSVPVFAYSSSSLLLAFSGFVACSSWSGSTMLSVDMTSSLPSSGTATYRAESLPSDSLSTSAVVALKFLVMAGGACLASLQATA